MRRPPLVTMVTFNRLGNTIPSLNSLLSCEEDFDLYIIDNGSRDKTWEYLQTINDPRIKEKKRFDGNIGGAAAGNYGLSHRLPDQDWLNFEYDTVIHSKKFISDFREAYRLVPEAGAFSATILVDGVSFLEGLRKELPAHRFFFREGKEFLDSPTMGYCWYIPYETMNELGYLDEVSYGQDADFNFRIRSGLKRMTSYATWITCIMAPFGGVCETCPVNGNLCPGNKMCTKYYSRITTKFTEIRDIYKIDNLIQQRLLGGMSFKCSSVFGKEPMPENEKKMSLDNIDLYKKLYNDFLETLND
jgi:glycosyltransferase involved in cell wall biosynthesis